MVRMLPKGRCLVVGANGFLGSHLVDGLAQNGYRVVAFDRYSSAPKFAEHQSVEILKGDILSEPDLISTLEGVDYVFYSFSATTPFTSEDDPYSDIELNLKHCVSFFGSCVEKGVKKIVYLSSGGAIYGPTAEQKAAKETDLPLPVSPYGICKLATEHYLAYFLKKFGLPYLIFRVANPYGPRQVLKHSQGVIPAFIEKIQNNEQITVFGDGSSSRDYIFIGDAVDMMLKAFESEPRYNLYNIGSGRQTTLNEIIESLKRHMDRDFEVAFKPQPKTFVHSAQISIDRYTKEFGKPHITPIKQGIRNLLQDQAEN